jgi:hypothetical protein
MADIAQAAQTIAGSTAGTARPTRRPRDLRLDVLRGLAMPVIFIAHLPGNAWADWIPAKFGFSSGAEVFVFCSGIASAFAFGRTFERQGVLIGTARCLHRCWQVYFAHLSIFLLVMGLTALAARWLSPEVMTAWNFRPLVEDPIAAVPAMLSLAWQPHFLDILPMYLVLLALIPVMCVLARVRPWLPVALSAVIWACVQATGFNLPTVSGGVWFFNPFAWQFLFFLGFGLALGWLPRPRFHHGLLFAISLALVVLAVPLSFWGILERSDLLLGIRFAILPDAEPTSLPLLRLLHLLALAYVVVTLLEDRRALLETAPGRMLAAVGQQSLSAFQAGVVLAYGLGFLLDAVGRDGLTVAIANVTGIAALYIVARLAAWFKAPPWKSTHMSPAAHAATPEPRQLPTSTSRSRPLPTTLETSP